MRRFRGDHGVPGPKWPSRLRHTTTRELLDRRRRIHSRDLTIDFYTPNTPDWSPPRPTMEKKSSGPESRRRPWPGPVNLEREKAPGSSGGRLMVRRRAARRFSQHQPNPPAPQRCFRFRSYAMRIQEESRTRPISITADFDADARKTSCKSQHHYNALPLPG